MPTDKPFMSTARDAADRLANTMVEKCADHYVILVGYVPVGEEHVEPIALHDGLYESAEYAMAPEVVEQALDEVLNAANDPDLWSLHRSRFVVRVGALRITHESALPEGRFRPRPLHEREG